LIVSESENSTITRQDIARMKISGNVLFESVDKEAEIEFQKIKLSYSIYTKFSIK